MAKKGLAGVPIAPLIIIVIGIVVVLYILKNKNLFRFGTPVTATAVTIGDTVPGPNVYPVVGPALTSGSITIRSSGTSFRDNQSYDCSKCARESTWFFNPGGGDDVSIKMGSHGDEGQQTSLIGFSTDGQHWRCEGPHMSYQDLDGEGSVELGSTKVGIKGISWNVSGGTQHHEIWLNEDGTGASWTKMAEFEGESSCVPLSCPVPSGQNNAHCQDTQRIDDPSGHDKQIYC